MQLVVAENLTLGSLRWYLSSVSMRIGRRIDGFSKKSVLRWSEKEATLFVQSAFPKMRG